jgi:hypothetical protein
MTFFLQLQRVIVDVKRWRIQIAYLFLGFMEAPNLG